MMTQLMNVADSIAAVVLYILIGLSVISLAITIERIVYFLQRRLDVTALGRELAGRLAERDFEGMRKTLRGSKTVEAAVMLEALDWVDRGTDSVHEVIEGSLREKKKEYERGLLYLGTLGNNAPFIGLFGTVLGIVSAFKELGNAGASGQMGNVMSGISEALIATGVGLVVAIPAVVTFNYFQSRATQIEDNVATLTNYLFAQMKSLTGPAKHAHPNHAPAPQSEQAFSSSAV